MKKLALAILALAASLPAAAGSHVESLVSYTIPASQNPVVAPRLLSVKYQWVVTSEHEEGNCDLVSTNGSLDDCHTVATHAYRVRISVGYDSPAGANPTPEASAADAESGPVVVNFDLDPAQFDAATLAAIKGTRNARDLFVMTTSVAPTTMSVVDYDRSFFCSPEADSSCENQVVEKQVQTTETTVSVKLR
jgi:hypothetical protein